MGPSEFLELTLKNDDDTLVEYLNITKINSPGIFFAQMKFFF